MKQKRKRIMTNEEKRGFEQENETVDENIDEAAKDAQKGNSEASEGISEAQAPGEEKEEQSEEAAPGTEEAEEQKVEDAAAKAEHLVTELTGQLLRLQADFQNYKRRTAEERSSDIEFANKKLAVALLDVIDNFERALGSESSDPQFKGGMELILKQLMAVLEKNHIVPIEAEGKQFDPNFHNAVQMLPSEDKESGTIISVLQKGYTLNGKLIRPAMVIVAQ